MLRLFARLSVSLCAAATLLSATASKAEAQAYPIDCAILLCLSGGWPASEPCARARAEFIRRITPWPVEPPLQIWRCPMGASYQNGGSDVPGRRRYDIWFQPFRSLPQSPAELLLSMASASAPGSFPALSGVADRPALRLVLDRADIDISGPDFNFVRSIRVFDVRMARQRETGEDGNCTRAAYVLLGTYGTQGEFSWRRSSPEALPEAHSGLERWGDHCPSIFHRSVFVEWQDYAGNYGYEQVNY